MQYTVPTINLFTVNFNLSIYIYIFINIEIYMYLAGDDCTDFDRKGLECWA